jgi:alpha-D-ribose 1-methylphosphonate 5-triphosphate diphosphatase
LAEQGLLDVLSSDYFPFSLLHAAFLLADAEAGLQLPHAVALVSQNPARAAGLSDRGVLAPGHRADLVRVRCDGGVPIVRGVWRQGQRVA